MKIAVYALAKNEHKHAVGWADSCREADLRVVTDTGSTDGTVEALEAAGVAVARGYVVPWRWDDAHNLSLYHVPPEYDVCIRLDLDERLQPGWREAVERAWTGGVTQLRYRYVWSWKADGQPGLEFLCDRVHSRHGYRWTGATHEGLVRWHGESVQGLAEGLEIHHHRDSGKKHTSDLELLRVATREAPHDARARWYLAREMDYAGMPEAAAEFVGYLKMPGGTPTERAYAMRTLARLTGNETHLHWATKAAPEEPDAWQELAYAAYGRQEWQACADFAHRAVDAAGYSTHCTDPMARGKAMDLAAVSLWQLGRRHEALTMARRAVGQCPEDGRLVANVASMERSLAEESAA